MTLLPLSGITLVVSLAVFLQSLGGFMLVCAFCCEWTSREFHNPAKPRFFLLGTVEALENIFEEVRGPGVSHLRRLGEPTPTRWKRLHPAGCVAMRRRP